MVIFRSRSASLRVSFPPDTFGYGKGPDGATAPYQAAKFVNGEFKTSKETVIERMKVHSGNEANGGTSFWMEEPEVSKNALGLLGELAVTTTDLELTEKDKQLITDLETIKGIMGSRQESYRMMLIELIDRFGITGIKSPEEEISEKRLRARITEALGVLEDEGIWPVKE